MAFGLKGVVMKVYPSYGNKPFPGFIGWTMDNQGLVKLRWELNESRQTFARTPLGDVTLIKDPRLKQKWLVRLSYSSQGTGEVSCITSGRTKYDAQVRAIEEITRRMISELKSRIPESAPTSSHNLQLATLCEKQFKLKKELTEVETEMMELLGLSPKP